MTTPTGQTYDNAAAEAAGVDLTEIVFEDYFGFSEFRKWYFPDGKQYIEYKLMTEGDKVYYQRETKSSVKISRNSGEAAFDMDQGKERTELIRGSVVGWRMYKRDPEGGRNPIEVSFSKPAFQEWLRTADPVLVQKLEFQIRKDNPWLLGDAEQSIEEYEKEIARLTELRDLARDRLQGEGSSSGK